MLSKQCMWHDIFASNMCKKNPAIFVLKQIFRLSSSMKLAPKGAVSHNVLSTALRLRLRYL